MSHSLSETEKTINYIKKNAKEPIEVFNKFLKEQKLLIFFMAKKMAGKSTYIRYINEVLPGKFVEVSVGDIVRRYQELIEQEKTPDIELRSAINNGQLTNYKTPEEVIGIIKSSSVQKLLPDDLAAFLLQEALEEGLSKNSVRGALIDGFPRTKKQVEQLSQIKRPYYRKGFKVIFFEFSVPESVLKQRILDRRICPKCGLNKNLLTNVTKEVIFDKKKKEFVLLCENPDCQKMPLIQKKGDNSLQEALERNKKHVELIDYLKKKYPENFLKVMLYVLLSEAKVYDLEGFSDATTFVYKEGRVLRHAEKLVVKENGRAYYSMNPKGAVVFSLERIAGWLKSSSLFPHY